MTQTTKKRVLIRAARAKPLERNAVYVLRDGWPRLVCPDCVAESDLYIWGTREVLHPDDRPKEARGTEAAEEAVPEEAGAAGPEVVEVSSIEEQLECI